MKRIVWIVKPLPREEEFSEIGDRLCRWFDDVIADRLCQAVVVMERETRATPRFAAHAKYFPFSRGDAYFLKLECAGWINIELCN